MKRHSLLISFLILSLSNYGQNYGNIWYFANKAGIDFNGCNPVVLTNGASSSSAGEGVSTICDNTGQLLFYTNSDTVWNKNHIAMPNGNIFNADGTLSQVIIIPKPLSSSIYYIITTEVQAGASAPMTMQYHVVDMTLNGGLGDLSSKYNLLNSNPTTEQVAATFHNNGTDIWLMTHEYGTNNFLAYLVTASGISLTPVISSVGPSHIACTSNMNARGEIKFSPNGSKVAFNANGVGGAGNDNTNILTLFDFDNNTGIVSNPINLPFSRGEYGLTFSPDNSKLYGATWKAFSFAISDSEFVYQFDLSSGIPSNIISSKTIIHWAPITGDIYGDLKIGPNGKIYIGKFQASSLDVIDSPNLPGLSCNYVSNGLYLNGQTGMYGLNNYIEYTNYCIENDIKEENNIFGFKFIYPNPFSFETILKTNDNLKNATLTIYNALGQEIKILKNISGQEIKLQRDNLLSGIYFIRITQDNKVIATSKLVVAD